MRKVSIWKYKASFSLLLNSHRVGGLKRKILFIEENSFLFNVFPSNRRIKFYDLRSVILEEVVYSRKGDYKKRT